MAATVSIQDSWDLGGNKTGYLLNIAFDSSYPTGGEAIDVSGAEGFAAVIPFAGKEGYGFEWDAAGQKLLAYYADYDAAADGALIQVPNTTDLSGLATVRAFAISD